MAFRSLSLYPVFNNDALFSDRFNRIDRLFSQLTGDQPVTGTPEYDIRRIDEQNYTLTISVPGWKEKELGIETVGGQLNINGKKEHQNQSKEDGWLYRGINRGDFDLKFSLPENMKVTGAKLEEGLLHVLLCQEIPEHAKPKRINIGDGKNSSVIEHRK
ncbi:Hsp20 family protein [Candidatus Ishikawella capsulata]|uniref:Heat shock chaperone n=1 Tax=Candidatus Ishikawaella capsulata Mpkobe TaxID=476281 RepID=C5WD01_9ENTR|nr:Hsp20 family protein [Candidatus Ishikawaella capsulata]BAH83207.1 heat shock chaperone [Candidatus Ishikawaella capsulata Mpkobe]